MKFISFFLIAIMFASIVIYSCSKSDDFEQMEISPSSLFDSGPETLIVPASGDSTFILFKKNIVVDDAIESGLQPYVGGMTIRQPRSNNLVVTYSTAYRNNGEIRLVGEKDIWVLANGLDCAKCQLTVGVSDLPSGIYKLILSIQGDTYENEITIINNNGLNRLD